MARSSNTQIRHASLATLVLVTLGACSQGASLPLLPPYDPHNYQLGVEDQIRVITYGQDQLSTDFAVNEHGTVTVPLLGDLQAQGLTTAEFAAEMAAELEKKHLLRHPNVSVEVSAYRPLAILGEVVKPSQYAYQPSMTLLMAVALAGGYTYRAVEDYAYVERHDGEHVTIGRLLPQSYVKPGDVIKIYERHF